MNKKWQLTDKGTVATGEFIATLDQRLSKGEAYFGKHWREQIKNVTALVRPKAGDIILDVGCGSGKYEAKFSHYCKITGTDISEKMLQLAMKHAEKFGNKKNFSLVLKTKPLGSQFKKGQFNKVMLIDLLEHLQPKEFQRIFSEVKPLLAQNGKLFIYTPNRCYWVERLPEWLHHHDKGHINLLSAKELQNALEENGFKIERLYIKESASMFAPIERLLPFNSLKKRICAEARAVK